MDYTVHGVAMSRTPLSDFHFHFRNLIGVNTTLIYIYQLDSLLISGVTFWHIHKLSGSVFFICKVGKNNTFLAELWYSKY